MKKLLAAAAVAAASVIAVTTSGCAGTSFRNLASLSSNWYVDWTFKGIQPTFAEGSAAYAGPEKLTYKVTQAAPSANGYYSVEYGEGVYTTEFHAKQLSREDLEKITDESFREDYTHALGSTGTMTAYYYRTVLTMPTVTYTCGNETAVFENDSVVSESYFMSVKDFLSPIYSKQVVHSTTPREISAASVEECYSVVDRVYESFYTLSGSDVKSVITDNLAEGEKVTTFTEGGMTAEKTNSNFDRAYLDVVARALKNMTLGVTQAITLYTPGMNARNYYLVAGNTALLDDADAASAQLDGLQKIFEDKGLFTPEEIKAEDGTVNMTRLNTLSVTVQYQSPSFTGVSQTYWFANDGGNRTRTIPVKMAVPLTFNLGRLDYVLTSIDNLPEY